MAQYDASKDKIFKEWASGNTDGDIKLKLASYNKGAPKLRMTRIKKSWKDDSLIETSKIGGLHWEDLQFLKENIDEIEEKFSEI